MKTSCILTATIALLLAPSLFAVTDTWDGGGGASNGLNIGANWVDNTAPLSDLVNTDLIFAGAVGLAPNVSAVFSTNSVTFNNTAGAFVFAGTTLNIGAGGIVNNDTQTQTFDNAITLGAASASFNAASGGLTFNNNVNINANTLALDGAGAFSFGVFFGGGAVNKNGAGTMTWAPNIAQTLDLAINAGTVNTVADATADVFSAAASIAVNGTSTFNINENLTLDGAQLTRATGAGLTLAAGKTLTVQNGGDVIVTGAFNRNTASTVTVTGTGSTLSATATSSFNSGSITNVLSGATLTLSSGTLQVGNTTNGTLNVDGSVSSATASFFSVGASGGTGVATFSNGSLGSFGAGNVNIGNSLTAGTSGTLNIQSGATVTTGGLTIGHISNPTAGTVAITTGGTLNPTGNIVVNGLLTRDATSFFGLGSLATMTVQNGGDVQFTGSMTFGNSSTINVTGAGSTLIVTSGSLAVNGDDAMSVLAGADVSAISAVNIGVVGAGTMLVDGAGSTLSAGGTSSWGIGALATVTFSNTASGSFGTMHLANSSSAGTSADVDVLSGATLATGSITIGVGGGTATGSLTIDGAGSAVTQVGSATLSVGSSLAGSGTLAVQNGGAFTSGTGTIVVNAGGTVNIVNGDFNANANVTVSGGQFHAGVSGDFVLAANRTLTVQAGGDASFGNILFLNTATSKVTVSGAGSTLSGASFFTASSNTVTVSNGGSMAFGNYILGTGSLATITSITGAGSSVSATGTFEIGQGTHTLSAGATGTFGVLQLDAELSALSAVTGSLIVQSGATVTSGNLRIVDAGFGGGNTNILTVTGAGTSYTQTGASSIGLGNSGVTGTPSAGVLNVADSSNFVSGTGSISLNATGTINLDGGTLDLRGALLRNGGALNFNTGELRIIDPLVIGTGGLLGANLTLDTTRRVVTTATTTIDSFRTLTLNGGSFSTGALVNNGTLAFNSGTLAVTGAGGYNIGSGGLGANGVLGLGVNLQVTNTATVASGAALTLNGGAFTAGTLANSGTVRANLGTASVASGTNNSGGRIFIGDTLAISGAFTNAAGGRITLEVGAGLLSGAGVFTNSGVLTGDGTIAKPLTNAATGEVRGELGRTLNFTTAATNSGQFNLAGGTLDFSSTLANNATGFISGHGALLSTLLTNNGQIALSGGDTDIRGDVTNTAGARIVTSGGATTTFFDDVIHNGTEIRTSAGGASVFFGAVSGAGPYTGTGTVYFEGDLRPGNSPASVLYEGDLVLGGSATLTLELGGLLLGGQYDHLNVGGTLFADGVLDVVLYNGFAPHFGDTFDLFDASAVAGNFDDIRLPALVGGLAWDDSQLSSTGTLRVVPEPSIGVLLASALTLFGARRRRSKNHAVVQCEVF